MPREVSLRLPDHGCLLWATNLPPACVPQMSFSSPVRGAYCGLPEPHLLALMYGMRPMSHCMIVWNASCLTGYLCAGGEEHWGLGWGLWGTCQQHVGQHVCLYHLLNRYFGPDLLHNM
jgi:hypothetical protein